MNIKIDLPATLAITSRDQTVTLDVGKLSPELIAKACLHGLTQKVADAAAGAKKLADDSDDMTVEAATVSLMQSVVETLEGGSWGRERGSGSGLTERDRVARIIVGDWFRNIFAKENPDHAKVTAYADADSAGRYAIIDAIWADNEETFGEAVDDEVAARKAKAKKVAGISVSI